MFLVPLAIKKLCILNQYISCSTTGSLPLIDFGGIQLPPGTSQQPQGMQPSMRQPVEPDAATLRQMLLSNPGQLSRLKETNPPLADAVESLGR